MVAERSARRVDGERRVEDPVDPAAQLGELERWQPAPRRDERLGVDAVRLHERAQSRAVRVVADAPDESHLCTEPRERHRLVRALAGPGVGPERGDVGLDAHQRQW